MVDITVMKYRDMGIQHEPLNRATVLSLDEIEHSHPDGSDLNLGMIFMIEQWKMEILTSDGTSEESNREW